jgi:hypothetical protein
MQQTIIKSANANAAAQPRKVDLLVGSLNKDQHYLLRRPRCTRSMSREEKRL